MMSNSGSAPYPAGSIEVDAGEPHGIPQAGSIRICHCSSRAKYRSIEIGREAHQRPRSVDAFGAAFSARGIDIGPDDLDVVAIDLGQFSISHIAIE